jgi:hypothetical protein
MALKRYFKPAAVTLIFLASGGVFALAVAALGAVLDREYSTLAALIPIFIALAVVFGVAIPASRRKSLRPNYPRIEHLRIAGKYHVVGTSANMSGKGYHWSMGISPLHLRG